MPFEKISYLLRREDTRATRRYLAPKLDDLGLDVGVRDAVFLAAQLS